MMRSLRKLKLSLRRALAAAAAFGGMAAGNVWAQDFTLNPTYGATNLVADASKPYFGALNLESGGNVDASGLGSGCVGFVANAPDYRLNYTPGTSPLIFSVASNYDTTLVINGPDGRWYCDDDSGDGSNPLIRFSTPGAGQYDVWVGTYGEARLRPAQLQVAETVSEAERLEVARSEEAQRRAAVEAENERQRQDAENLRQVEERQRLEGERRARRVRLTARFGAEQAGAILAGEVLAGMSGEAVREALGEPRRVERVAAGEEM